MKTVKFLTLFILGTKCLSAEIYFPDFIDSMLRKTKNEDVYSEVYIKRRALFESANPKYSLIFKRNYEETIQAIQTCENNDYRIPPIVHQIWLGSPVPEKFKGWMESWKQIPGWSYKLWTDEDVAKMRLRNQYLYDRAENYGEKSDILRLEILERFGGLYVDTDFECYKPEVFVDLHKCADLFLGLEPLEHGFIGRFNMYKACNAIIAAIPHHPLIQYLNENMKANYLAYYKHGGAFMRTGPSFLSRIICRYEENKRDCFRNMYLPSTFFYPVSEPEVAHLNEHPEENLRIFPETAAVHYWTGSWHRPLIIQTDEAILNIIPKPFYYLSQHFETHTR